MKKSFLDIADDEYRCRTSDTVTLGALRHLATRVAFECGVSGIVKAAHENAVAKGFHEPSPTFGDFVALAHSELSEALEAYRENGLADGEREDGKPEGVASELADTVIRIADMCGALGIDLEAAIAKKMAFNAGRPWRHGGKKL